jgi:hypothetical protein
LPKGGAGETQGLIAVDERGLAGTGGLSAAADLFQVKAFDGRIGLAGETRQEFFHQLGPARARQTEGIGGNLIDGESHAETMRRAVENSRQGLADESVVGEIILSGFEIGG